MKEFDYETAWKQLARPMFEALPQNIRDLYSRVIQEAGHLPQLPNLNMRWPDHGDVPVDYLPEQPLRAIFDKIPAEILAPAARILYFHGHWHPGGGNADKVGGGWKFASYADESLAARINPALDPSRKHDATGLSYAIHQGFIRCQCNTPDSWTWEEVALATPQAWEKIKLIENREDVRVNLPGTGMPFFPHRSAMITKTGTFRLSRNDWYKFSQLAEDFMVLLRKECMPQGRIAEFLDTSKYMIEKTEIAARHAKEQAADPKRLERARATIRARFENTVYKATTERDGYLWLLDHGIDIENAIYYDHTKTWCFGWRTPLAPETISRLLDVLPEFPFQYEIKGYTPEVVK